MLRKQQRLNPGSQSWSQLSDVRSLLPSHIYLVKWHAAATNSNKDRVRLGEVDHFDEP